MNADDKSKLKAYEELIGSLEHTNGLQHLSLIHISEPTRH